MGVQNLSTLGERARSASRNVLIKEKGIEDDCVMLGHEVSDLRARMLDGSRQYHTNTGLKNEVLMIDEFVRSMSSPQKPYVNPMIRTSRVVVNKCVVVCFVSLSLSHTHTHTHTQAQNWF